MEAEREGVASQKEMEMNHYIVEALCFFNIWKPFSGKMTVHKMM